MAHSRSIVRTALVLCSSAALVAAVAACKKNETPAVVDAAPPAPTAPAPPEVAPVPLQLVPLEEDAGPAADAGSDAGAKRPSGPAVSPVAARLKQCCSQLRAQAKALGPSPESGLILGVAAQCDSLAASASASGTAPELGLLRAALAGRSLPPICSGF